MDNNLLPMTEFNAKDFSFTLNDRGAYVAVGEASTVGFHCTERIYADAADAGIAMKSPRTGRVERFYLLRIERDHEGDVLAFHFQNISSACPVELATILND